MGKELVIDTYERDYGWKQYINLKIIKLKYG
jgi:hypothetical protein